MADVEEITKYVRRTSKIFEQEHPYVELVRRGSYYPPPEAGFKDPEEQAGEEEDGAAGGPAGPAKTIVVEDEGPAEAHEEDHPAAPPVSADFATGIKWHIKVWTDDVNDPKHCTATGELKQRRPKPHVKASELISGLKKIDGNWIYEGPLNGWPALRGFMLRSLTQAESVMGFTTRVHRLWSAEDGTDPPVASAIPKGVRATFMSPSWCAIGWTPQSPGFAWWFSQQHGAPRLLLGEHMIEGVEADEPRIANAQAVQVHAFAHRYPVEKESWEDSQTWHCGVLVEWAHGQFTSLIELAWKNGCSGYGGKSNWCEDKLEPVTALFRVMIDGQKQPWDETKAEVRIYDLPARNKDEFVAYLRKYSNHAGIPLEQQRFLDPQIYDSAPVRLRTCKPADLAGFVLNYSQRTPTYDKLRSNCQTFTADMYAFLAGVKGVQPFSPAVRKLGMYTQRTMTFLYRPDYK